eukprot:jgi/Hompol1/6486/HPOL_000776-RA
MVPHKSHTLGFPIFSVCFTPSHGHLLVGGGGGATKAGIKNTVEKAFVAAVNSPEADVVAGNNLNCKMFMIQKSNRLYIESAGAYALVRLIPNTLILDIRLRLIEAIKTTDSLDPYNHQKAARFSPDGKILCTGTSDGKFSAWTWPSLTPAFPSLELGIEVMDIHFDPSGQHVCLITPTSLMMLDTVKGKIRWQVDKQTIGAEVCEFRAARFGTQDSADILFVALNAKSRKGSFIQKYSVRENKLLSTKLVSAKPITAVSISMDGSLLAFGSSDMSVSVLQTKTLA